MPPPATVSSDIAAMMEAPPSQSSLMCPASSTVSSLAAWTSRAAVDGGVQVRGLLGACVAGVLVEGGVHAHAVAPGDEVGVRLRAPGLDALGLAAAQRIAPGELLDALGAQLQGEGVIDRWEVEIRDRVGDRRRHENGQRVRRWEGRFGARRRGHRLRRHGGRGRGGVNHLRARRSGLQMGKDAPSHGEGSGSSRTGISASIARQSTSTLAAVAVESDWTMDPIR